MSALRLCSALAVVCTIGSLASEASASMLVRHMSLQQMCHAAARIFRGTVLGVTEGTVTVGGSQLPTIVYRLRVDEAFKGSYQLIKGQRIATLQMVQSGKRPQLGPIRRLAMLDGLPQFAEGHDYVILATAPSPIGLSTTVGLKQGAFTVNGKAGQEMAVNGNDNIGLAASAATGVRRGPIPYASLRDSIRRFVGR
jgi:hypothetical protein